MPRPSSGWLTVTNREVPLLLLVLLGCEETGGGRARRNPAGLRERLGGGISFEEFVRFDMKEGLKDERFTIFSQRSDYRDVRLLQYDISLNV